MKVRKFWCIAAVCLLCGCGRYCQTLTVSAETRIETDSGSQPVVLRASYRIDPVKDCAPSSKQP